MKTISTLKGCAIAALLVGFMGTAIAADRYSTIAGIVAVWEANLGAGDVWETEFSDALSEATDAQLLEIQNATNYDAVRAILQGRNVPVQLEGVTGIEALGSLTSDLVFTPVVPCRFFDTRNDSDTGSIGHTSGPTTTVRSYQVYGDVTTIQAQGGSVPCPAPSGEPVGISANFTAAPLASPSTGKGNIRAYPAGGTLPGVSLVNYEAGTNIANAAIVATCYLCGFDLDVATQFHSSASIGDVMGYFYPAIEQELPPGAVMHFTTSTCPTGWGPLQDSTGTDITGRYIVGLSPGLASTEYGATVGNPLGASEDRVAGAHTHQISDNYSFNSGGSTGTGLGSGVQNRESTSSVDTTGNQRNYRADNSTAVEFIRGTNAPYVQLLVCEKQ